MEKINWKKIMPHAAAVALFVIISSLYFVPAFKGKVLMQSDIMHFEGMSREIVQYRDSTGEEALWTNSMFGGMPAWQISVLYPSNLVRHIHNLLQLGLPAPANFLFLYLIGFYILLITLRMDYRLAIAGAIGFAFSSYFLVIVEVGHNTKALAIAYMAPVLAGVILAFERNRLAGFALATLALALQIYVNHPQITYYLFFIILIYGIFRFISDLKEKKLPDFFKTAALLGAGTAIALGCNITGLWGTMEYSKYSTRGGTELTINPDGSSNKSDATSGLDKSYITQYSYGVSETMTLLIPEFKGGASEPIGDDKKILKNVQPELRQPVANMYRYFGDQPIMAGPVYVGAIMVFLFILGLFLVKGPIKWVLAISTLLSIWLSWGKNDPFGLTDFFLDFVPAYNKFRAVSMVLVIAELTIPLMAVITLHRILTENKSLADKILLWGKTQVTRQRALVIAFALTGGVALMCYLVPEMFTSFTAENEYELWLQRYKASDPGIPEEKIRAYLDAVMPATEIARKAIVKSDALRSFFFIFLAAGLLWAFMKKKISAAIFLPALMILVAVDMIGVDWRYLNKDNFTSKQEIQIEPNRANLQILNDPDPNFRVWNRLSRLDQDAQTSYFHKSLGGYHGAKMGRFQELIDFHIYAGNPGVINMLNTKYLIDRGEDGGPVPIPNPGAMGNAWFVKEYKLVENADSEITAMRHFDPAVTAIVDTRFSGELSGFKPAFDPSGAIKLVKYAPNHLVYESKTASEQLAVFSEIYYDKGWNAYVDGKLMPHVRANYVLRAMRVPAGNHKIEFKFEPKSYYTGETVSLVSSLLLLIVCGGALFLQLRKKGSSSAVA